MFLSDDDMVECPYNKSHRMLRKRLQSHLLKCRLSYPDVELRKCPFNITHLIPEPEFTHHATNCSDRKLITQYKYDAPNETEKEEEGPKHAPIECDEDWDDTDVNDYNPQLYVEHANVIRKPEGANPTFRKNFIKQERKRLGDGDVDDEDDTESKGSVIRTPSPPYMSGEINFSDDAKTVDKSPKNHYKYADVGSSKSNRRNGSSSSTNKSRRKRSDSPSTSSYSKRRSRSPRSKRDRSPGYRSYRERSPLRSSPDYTRRYSPPSTAVYRTLEDYNPDEDPYYNGGGVDQSSRNAYYRENMPGPGAYYDRHSATSSTMSHEHPAPLISYPAPKSYLTSKHPPADY